MLYRLGIPHPMTAAFQPPDVARLGTWLLISNYLKTSDHVGELKPEHFQFHETLDIDGPQLQILETSGLRNRLSGVPSHTELTTLQ